MQKQVVYFLFFKEEKHKKVFDIMKIVCESGDRRCRETFGVYFLTY